MTMEQSKTIALERNRLTYLKSGNGKQTLITLHGFGQSAGDFQVIEEAFPGHQFYHLNLFFHDSYLHPAHRPLSQTKWLELFANFLAVERIEKFSMAGFSIGCRFVYHIAEGYVSRLENVILFAPEGENFNFWYRAAVSVFRGLFRFIVFRPTIFFSMLNMLVRIKLLNNSVARFARSQMKRRSKRWLVYVSWVHFRLLRFNLKKWAQVMNRHQVPVIIFTGENDKMIPAGNAKPICRKLKRVTHYHIKSGHQDLLKRSAEFLNRLKK